MSRLAILMYHAVVETYSAGNAHLCCSAGEFRRQMQWLKEAGYCFLSLSDAVTSLSEKRNIAQPAVAVTFDDGYRAVLEHALPVLQDLDIPVTVFAVAGCLGKRSDWVDDIRGQLPLLTSTELRELVELGVNIGSHSWSHPRLSELPSTRLDQEIRGSRERLEDILGASITDFAYPYGDFSEKVKATVYDAGYRIACSTRSGFNTRDTDPYSLRRLDIRGSDSLRQFRHKVCMGTNHWSLADEGWYYWRRLRSHAGIRSKREKAHG